MLDRSTPPTFVRDFSFELIQPEKAIAGIDVPVYFVPGGDQNVIKIEVVFHAGTWFESQMGVSHFTASLLNKGTSTRSSYEIASQFDELGAHFEMQPGEDFVFVTVLTLTKKLQEVLSLLIDIIQKPTFEEREFEQASAIYLQNLKVNAEKTNFLAGRQFRQVLFGSLHPYGKNIDENHVAAITVVKLKEFYKSNYQYITVFASGKLSATSKETILEAFSSFKNSPPTPIDHLTPENDPSIIHVDKPGSIQSSLRVGKRSIPRTSPDFPGWLLLNHLLGGYFGSRLMKNIREEKGLTYGVHSSLINRRHDNYIVVGTDVNKDNKNVALLEIRKELDQLINTPVSLNELDTVKCHLLGSLQSDLSTTFAHEERIKTIILHSLPSNYYTQLTSAIEEISKESLLNIAQQHLDPNSFYWVSVG